MKKKSILFLLILNFLNGFDTFEKDKINLNIDKLIISDLDINNNYSNLKFYLYEDSITAEWADKEKDIYLKNKQKIFKKKNGIYLINKNNKKVFFSYSDINKILGKNKSFLAYTTNDIKKIILLFLTGNDNIKMYLALNENTPFYILKELVKSKNTIISSNAKSNLNYIKKNNLKNLKKIKNIFKKDQKYVEIMKLINFFNSTYDMDQRNYYKIIINKKLLANPALYIYYNNRYINRFLSSLDIDVKLLNDIYINNLILDDFEVNMNLINNKQINLIILKKYSYHKNIFIKKRALKKLNNFKDDKWNIIKF